MCISFMKNDLLIIGKLILGTAFKKGEQGYTRKVSFFSEKMTICGSVSIWTKQGCGSGSFSVSLQLTHIWNKNTFFQIKEKKNNSQLGKQ